MYEHVGEQMEVLHAVDGAHAPPVLTILCSRQSDVQYHNTSIPYCRYVLIAPWN